LDERNGMFVGNLEIRPPERAVLVHGHDVPLTSAEFDIVMMLAEHPGWVYSPEQLSSDADDGLVSPESVSVLVSRLRHRLAEAGAPDVVETVRGFGYRLHSQAHTGDDEPPADRVTCELRDAAWRLQEAVIEVEHSGTPEQKCAVTAELETVRVAIHAVMDHDGEAR
jgi:DNA-binding winged helix-turn-helix (wHTH) protein